MTQHRGSLAAELIRYHLSKTLVPIQGVVVFRLTRARASSKEAHTKAVHRPLGIPSLLRSYSVLVCCAHVGIEVLEPMSYVPIYLDFLIREVKKLVDLWQSCTGGFG